MNGADLAWTVVLALGAAVVGTGAVMTLINLRVMRRPGGAPPQDAPPANGAPRISVCVPARNEERNLGECVGSLLRSRGVAVEVLVYDDHSTDSTPAILARLIAEDPRVRAVATRGLPPGWNGKQFGCQQMGESARGEWLLFTDADVRFHPDALATALAEARRLQVQLLSTVPRQETGSILEHLVVPLIHFILLSYLPMPRMRRSRDPAASAGCGQFLLVERRAWEAAGGHAGFRDSMHDGIRLPRAVRRAGGRSDLYDGTPWVSCRMYRGAGACFRGFAKNAFEGLGSVTLLVMLTLMHLAGHLAPWLWLAWAAWSGRWTPAPTALAALCIAVAALQRGLMAIRFRQSWLGVLLHPVGILAMTVIQWWSLVLALRGRREWRGRVAGVESASA
ncbi:MAG: glycosyltransferase family 2 protein [Phycisphaerales bacterium]